MSTKGLTDHDSLEYKGKEHYNIFYTSVKEKPWNDNDCKKEDLDNGWQERLLPKQDTIGQKVFVFDERDH